MFDFWRFQEIEEYREEDMIFDDALSELIKSPKRDLSSDPTFYTQNEEQLLQVFQSHQKGVIQEEPILRESSPEKKSQRSAIKIEVNPKKMKNILNTKAKTFKSTLNLSYYIHQITVNYLSLLKKNKSLSYHQEGEVQAYIKMDQPSLENQIKFFLSKRAQLQKTDDRGISLLCMQFYCSTVFIGNILSSRKMEFQRKIQVFKNLDQILLIAKAKKEVKLWRKIKPG